MAGIGHWKFIQSLVIFVNLGRVLALSFPVISVNVSVTTSKYDIKMTYKCGQVENVTDNLKLSDRLSGGQLV